VRSIENATTYLADELAKKIEQGSRVAVVGVFNVEAETLSELHDTLTENLTTDLVKSSGEKFSVVERRLIHQALKELGFQETDLVDRSKAARVGEFLGATVIVSGTAQPILVVYRVNMRGFKLNLDIVAVARTYIIASLSRLFLGSFILLVIVVLLIFFVIRIIRVAIIRCRIKRA